MVVRLGHAPDDDRMIARVVGGLEVALECRKGPFDDRHTAVGFMGRNL